MFTTKVIISVMKRQKRSFCAQSDCDWNNARPYETIPGPNRLSLVKRFLPGGKYYEKDLKQLEIILQSEYGNLVRLPGVFGKRDIVFTFDAEHYEKIYRTEGIWPMRRGLDSIVYYRKIINHKLFGSAGGLIAEQGEKWANFRRIVNPVVMQTKNTRIYFPKMNNVADQFLERIRSIRDINSNEVPGNFESDINLWTLESIGVVALDRELGLLNGTDKDPNAIELINAMSTFFRLCYELDVKPSFWKIIKTPTFYEMMNALETVTDLTIKYIDEAITKFKANQSEADQSILERLLKIDKNIAIVMSMDLLFGGVDSTTSAIVACLLGLAKNPEKQEILRSELMQILPEKDTPVTSENTRRMPYLRACIKEGLRFYPVTTGNLRSVGQNIVLHGYQVPQGTDMVMPNVFLYRDDCHFACGNTYIPERWLRTQSSANECPMLSAPATGKPLNPFAYLPFGFGPRMCIGKRLVDMELEIGVAKIIRNFRVEFNYSDEKIFKANVINVPDMDLKFKFVDIDKSE